VPYFRQALADAKGELVFPREDGVTMMRGDTRLDRMLRRAMGRAGVVLHFNQVCRRRGCGFTVETKTDDELRCPKCAMKLWPSRCRATCASTIFGTPRRAC
jgi:hypothetical protein